MDDRRERQVTLVLVGAILVSTLGVMYLAATPDQRADPFTEFYIEGAEGNAADYPQNLSVGETGTVTVGIANHEHQTMRYTLVMHLDGETIESQAVTVGNEETWERERSFTPRSSGRKRLQIHLYRGGDVAPDAEPYLSLRLWVTVES